MGGEGGIERAVFKFERQRLLTIRESSLNMTRGDGDIEGEGELQNSLDTRKGGSEKIVGLGRGAPKIFIL